MNKMTRTVTTEPVMECWWPQSEDAGRVSVESDSLQDKRRRMSGLCTGGLASSKIVIRETAGLSNERGEYDRRAAGEGVVQVETVVINAEKVAIFDCTILDELADMLDDDQELDSYLALLEPTVRPRVAALVRQSAAGELAGMLMTAHALAGGSACYGLCALSAAARQAEEGARTADPGEARQGVLEAVALVETSLSAVSRWRSARTMLRENLASLSRRVAAS